MNGFKLSTRDRRRLRGVHPDLARVVERAAAISPVRFMVVEGLRTRKQQQRNMQRGVSWTMKSRHIPDAKGIGHAVDIAPLDEMGNPIWSWPKYHELAPYLKAAAEQLGVPVEWGGDWRKTKDGPHWQLPWRQYPPAGRVAGPASDQPVNPETETQALVSSRSVMANAAQITTGSTIFGGTTYQLQEAQYHLSSGTLMGYAIAAVIIIPALIGVYARWDDAGRPGLKQILTAWRSVTA